MISWKRWSWNPSRQSHRFLSYQTYNPTKCSTNSCQGQTWSLPTSSPLRFERYFSSKVTVRKCTHLPPQPSLPLTLLESISQVRRCSPPQLLISDDVKSRGTSQRLLANYQPRMHALPSCLGIERLRHGETYAVKHRPWRDPRLRVPPLKGLQWRIKPPRRSSECNYSGGLCPLLHSRINSNWPVCV